MASVTVEIGTEVAKVDASEQLKAVLVSLTEQATVIKGLIASVRNVIKDSDKQSKELEKLRNKRTRVKTERSADALPSGITKPVAITDELAVFLGVAPGTLVPRNEVTKGVSAYVKKNEISDPTNKQKFVLDDRPAAKALKKLLGNPAEDVTYFNLQKYLKHHYIVSPDAVPATPKKTKKPAEKKAEPVAAAPAPVVAEPEKKKVKKVVVKKKTELTEEA
jgi:chromatin remodeling complex protein RSC6